MSREPQPESGSTLSNNSAWMRGLGLSVSVYLGTAARLLTKVNASETGDTWHGVYSVDGVLDVATKTSASAAATVTQCGYTVEVEDSSYRIKICKMPRGQDFSEYVYSKGEMSMLHRVTQTQPVPAADGTNFSGSQPRLMAERQSRRTIAVEASLCGSRTLRMIF